jgi:hypothetical protein
LTLIFQLHGIKIRANKFRHQKISNKHLLGIWVWLDIKKPTILLYQDTKIPPMLVESICSSSRIGHIASTATNSYLQLSLIFSKGDVTRDIHLSIKDDPHRSKSLHFDISYSSSIHPFFYCSAACVLPPILKCFDFTS